MKVPVDFTSQKYFEYFRDPSGPFARPYDVAGTIAFSERNDGQALCRETACQRVLPPNRHSPGRA